MIRLSYSRPTQPLHWWFMQARSNIIPASSTADDVQIYRRIYDPFESQFESVRVELIILINLYKICFLLEKLIKCHLVIQWIPSEDHQELVLIILCMSCPLSLTTNLIFHSVLWTCETIIKITRAQRIIAEERERQTDTPSQTKYPPPPFHY